MILRCNRIILAWLLALVILSHSSIAPKKSLFTDEYEPDDKPEEAKWITPDGTPQERMIVKRGDVDWVKFRLEAGRPYIIETKPVKPIGIFTDTILVLYYATKSGLKEVARDDDSGEGECSRIIFFPKNRGVYYAKIWHKDKRKFGFTTKYTFSVTPFLPSIKKFSDGHDLPDSLSSFDIRSLTVMLNTSLILKIRYFARIPSYFLKIDIDIDADNNPKEETLKDYFISLAIMGDKVATNVKAWNDARGELEDITPKGGYLKVSPLPFWEGIALSIPQWVFREPPLGKKLKIRIRSEYSYTDTLNAVIEYKPGIRVGNYRKNMVVDGKTNDWSGIPPLYVDKEEPVKGIPGFSDLKAIYMAHNSTHLIIRVDTKEEEIISVNNSSELSRSIWFCIDGDFNQETGFRPGEMGAEYCGVLGVLLNSSKKINAYVWFSSWNKLRRNWEREKRYSKSYENSETIEWAIPLIDIPSFGKTMRFYFIHMTSWLYDYFPDNLWEGGWINYEIATEPAMGIYGLAYLVKGEEGILLPEVEVKALSPGGRVLASTTTDDAGFYYLEIEGLKRGNKVKLLASFGGKNASIDLKFNPYTMVKKDIVIESKE